MRHGTIKERIRFLGVMGVVMLMASCGREGGESASLGALQMPLTAYGPSGARYQLLHAILLVDGAAAQKELHTDEDPERLEILVDLPMGSYSIELLPGWQMTRDGNIVDSTLESEATQNFYIAPDETVNVRYRFLVSDESVSFGGTLQVQIEIEETVAEPENHPAVCADGLDNDLDGWIDCADPKCGPFCPPGEPEDHPAVCEDGLDNDQDGWTDCADPDCAPFCQWEPEDHPFACADGLDNDQDGLTDCADPECAPMCPFEPENHPAVCNDGLDNDRDGWIDCADPDCQGFCP